MSLTNSIYSRCAYNHRLKESTGVHNYSMETPWNDCQPCFPSDPHVRVNRFGADICTGGDLVDVDSELMGLTRKNSDVCPENKYAPKPGEICNKRGTMQERDCRFIAPEHSRFTNPPCELRGTGWNRWEDLCYNPQKFAMRDFNTMINERLNAKDNHRPCIKEPIEKAPPPKPMECVPANYIDDMQDGCSSYDTGPIINDGWHPANFNDKAPPSVTWQTCRNIQQY